jgi:hypothetical protein
MLLKIQRLWRRLRLAFIPYGEADVDRVVGGGRS